jgi:hypothetical protein
MAKKTVMQKDLNAAIRLLVKKNKEDEAIRKTDDLLSILEKLSILLEYKIAINNGSMHVSWKYNRRSKIENYTYKLSN